MNQPRFSEEELRELRAQMTPDEIIAALNTPPRQLTDEEFRQAQRLFVEELLREGNVGGRQD